MTRRLCGLAGLLLTTIYLFAALATAVAGDAPKVKVTVVVILASEEGNTIDPKLKAVAAQIQTQNANLKSFKLERMSSRSLAEGEKSSFKLFEDKTVDIVVKQKADADNKVVLAVFAPNQGEIVYRSSCGKFLPIVTRCQTGTKERLILAISVQPCHGK